MTIRHVLGGIVAFHVQLVADGCEACIILTGGECATIPLKRSSDISSYLSSLVEESNGRIVEMPTVRTSTFHLARVHQPVAVCASFLPSKAFMIGLKSGEVIVVKHASNSRILSHKSLLTDLLLGSTLHTQIAIQGYEIESENCLMTFCVDAAGTFRCWDVNTGRCLKSLSLLDKKHNIEGAKICLQNFRDNFIVVVAIHSRSHGSANSDWKLFSYRCKVVPATAFLGLGCELNLIAESGSMRDILDVALSSSHLNLLCLVRGPSGELAVQWSEIDEPHTKPHPSDGAGSIGVIQFRRVGDVARAGFSSYDQRLLDFSPPVNGLLDEDECIESLLATMVRQIFLPNKFSLVTVRDVLEIDIPSRSDFPDDSAPATRSVTNNESLHIDEMAVRLVALLRRWSGIGDDVMSLLPTQVTAGEAIDRLRTNFSTLHALCVSRQNRENIHPVSLARFPIPQLSYCAPGMVVQPTAYALVLSQKAVPAMQNTFCRDILETLRSDDLLSDSTDYLASFNTQMSEYFFACGAITSAAGDYVDEILVDGAQRLHANTAVRIAAAIQSTSFDATAKQWLDELLRSMTITAAASFSGSKRSSFPVTPCGEAGNAGKGHILSETMRLWLANKLEHAQTIALTLALLSKSVSSVASVHSSLAGLIRQQYWPKVVFNLVYVSYLNWLYIVRPSTAAQHHPSFGDTSTIPNCHFPQTERYRRGEVVAVNAKTSVLNNFWMSIFAEHCLPTDDFLGEAFDRNMRDPLLATCEAAIGPYNMNALSCFLLCKKQFGCLSRLASMLQWGIESGCVLIPSLTPTHLTRSSTMVQEMFLSRARTLHTFSRFAIAMSDVMEHCDTIKPVDVQASSQCAVFFESASNLINAGPLLSFGSYNKEELENGKNRNSPRAGQTLHSVVAELENIVDMASAPTHSTRMDERTGGALACLMDMMLKMLPHPIFAEIINRAVEEHGYAAASGRSKSMATDIILDKYSYLFQDLARLRHLYDVQELIRRSCLILPPAVGSVLTLHIRRELFTTINSIGKALASTSGPRAELNTSIAFQGEYEVALSTGFESALSCLHMDEAWLAMLELESRFFAKAHGVALGASAAMLPEPRPLSVEGQKRLHSLVARACEKGKLGWLCNLPDDDTQMIDWKQYVADELFRLCRGTDLPQASEMDYYECLSIFFLCNHEFYDAAAVMLEHAERDADERDNLPDVIRQTWSLSACVHALSIGPDTSYIHQNLPPANYGTVGDYFDDRTPIPIKTIQNIRTTIQLKTSAVIVCMQERRRETIDRMDTGREAAAFIVKKLCTLGLCTDALSLVWMLCDLATGTGRFPSRPSPPSTTLFQPFVSWVIAASALLCAKAVEEKGQLPPDVSLAAGHGVVARGLGTMDSEHAHAAWNVLLDALSRLDGARFNWSLHGIAVRSILAKYPATCLPMSLMAAAGGARDCRTEQGSWCGLIMAMIEKRELKLACNIGVQMVFQLIDHVEFEREKLASSERCTRSQPPFLLPTLLVDELIQASDAESEAIAKELQATIKQYYEAEMLLTL